MLRSLQGVLLGVCIASLAIGPTTVHAVSGKRPSSKKGNALTRTLTRVGLGTAGTLGVLLHKVTETAAQIPSVLTPGEDLIPSSKDTLPSFPGIGNDMIGKPSSGGEFHDTSQSLMLSSNLADINQSMHAPSVNTTTPFDVIRDQQVQNALNQVNQVVNPVNNTSHVVTKATDPTATVNEALRSFTMDGPSVVSTVPQNATDLMNHVTPHVANTGAASSDGAVHFLQQLFGAGDSLQQAFGPWGGIATIAIVGSSVYVVPKVLSKVRQRRGGGRLSY